MANCVPEWFFCSAEFPQKPKFCKTIEKMAKMADHFVSHTFYFIFLSLFILFPNRSAFLYFFPPTFIRTGSKNPVFVHEMRHMQQKKYIFKK